MPQILTEALQPQYLKSKSLTAPDLQVIIRRAERDVLAVFDGGDALQGFDTQEATLFDALRDVIARVAEMEVDGGAGGAIKSFSQGDRSVTYRDSVPSTADPSDDIFKPLRRFDTRSFDFPDTLYF